jgi:hypothetical protein
MANLRVVVAMLVPVALVALVVADEKYGWGPRAALEASAAAPAAPAAPAVPALAGVWWDRPDGNALCREGALSPAQLIQRIQGMGGAAEMVVRGPREAPDWVFVTGGVWMHHFYRSGEACHRAAMRAAVSG